MQAIQNKTKQKRNNDPTGIFSKISRLWSMFLFFSVILPSMISKVRSMIFGRTFVVFPRYAFAILAFLATIPIFGFSASVFADSSSSAIYGDEGSVENSSNFSVTVEELNALELRLSASDLVLDLNPTSDAPVFGSSDLSVTVYTTNTTGYYLTMTPTTTNLTRTEALNGNYPTIATLASAVAPSTFSSTSDTTTANKWGYKVNTTNLSTIDTTNYNPAVTTAVPLNKTTAPLANGDETDITFAAKVDADTVAGSYKTTLSFTAVTNANTYSITFNPGSASSDASLTNMPSPNPQTGALESGSSTSITLSSSTPTRAGYSFLGWCSVSPTTSNNTDSCSGTTYQPNSSITIYTDMPDITLYAMWGINSYAITITNSNTSSSVNSLTIPYGGSATVTVTPSSGYYLSAVSCPSGYTCSGYNTGTSYTSAQTITITNNGTTSGGTLAFTGTKSMTNVGNMQNLPSSSCTTTAALATDNRDSQIYTIQRLADGKCWMMTNLNLGATTLTTDLTSANTNLSNTVTASAFNDWNRTTSGNSYSYTDPKFSPVNGADTTAAAPYGTLYNYCAASAGTICTDSNSSDASYDLCPAGWRLPTGNTEGEFATLYANASYNTYDKMRASVANGGAAFALAGIFNISTPAYQGYLGYYWSSTRSSNTSMYLLSLDTSNVNPSNNDDRDGGFSIRCILKEPLYYAVAKQSKGTQTAAQLKKGITKDNSGVYEYNTSEFGAASDAASTSTIYYYRGILDNTTGSYGSDGDGAAYPNYVKLDNNTCWRILRTTGSGGVKMIYNGTWTGSTCANAGTNAQLTTAKFNDSSATVAGTSYTGLQYKNMHAVGYTYSNVAAGTTSNTALSTLFGSSGNDTTTNTNSSIIKKYIESWYSSNMTSYTSHLEANAGYCADRTTYPDDSYALSSKLAESTTVIPYGTSSMTYYFYGAYTRNDNSAQTPTLGCPRGIVDTYSTTTASGGNGQLTYPVALITADEASFAGSGSSPATNGSSYNKNSFLRSGSDFWLLSPYYRSSGGAAIVFYLNSGGILNSYYVSYSYGVRPAISLASGTMISGGSGTATDPWTVAW